MGGPTGLGGEPGKQKREAADAGISPKQCREIVQKKRDLPGNNIGMWKDEVSKHNEDGSKSLCLRSRPNTRADGTHFAKWQRLNAVSQIAGGNLPNGKPQTQELA